MGQQVSNSAFRHRHTCGSICLVLVAILSSASVASDLPPGWVLAHLKISDTEGGFTGMLGNFDHFGGSAAFIGDLDGDGVVDIAVGAPLDGGAAVGAIWILFLNDDGTVESHQKISWSEGGFTGDLGALDHFGQSVASIGDFDADGVTDIAVGAPEDNDGGPARGAVWMLFLNEDGTVKSHQKISSAEGGFTGGLDDLDRFGSSVANIGDLDGDGVADLAVGAFEDDDGGTNRGAVWILFLNNDGTVKLHQKISNTEGGFTGTLDNGDKFGVSVASIGDLDADGVIDLAVGAFLDNDGGSFRGAVWVLFLNDDGTVKSHQKISSTEGGLNGPMSNFEFFGSSVARLGNFDSDDVPDLAVGAHGDNGSQGGLTGSVWVLLLNDDGTVKEELRISNNTGGFTGNLAPNDAFGSAVAFIDDLDGVGATQLAVGAYLDDDGGTHRGAVWMLFLSDANCVDDTDCDDFYACTSDSCDSLSGFCSYDPFVPCCGNTACEEGETPCNCAEDCGTPPAIETDCSDGIDEDCDTKTDCADGDCLDEPGCPGVEPPGWVLSHQKISDTEGGFTGVLDDFDFFGSSVASIGDLDGDGVADLAVGALSDDDGSAGPCDNPYYGCNRGAVWVLFLNVDGTVKSHQKISDTEGGFKGVLDDNDHFGSSVAAIGDLDGDGVADLAVGARNDDDGGNGRGAVWVLFLNDDGTVKSQQKISDTQGGFMGTLTDGAYFGSSVASIGDLDADGVTDLAVGAPFDDDAGAGAVWILFLNDDGTVKSHQKISDFEGEFTGTLDYNDQFGRSVASVGDLDGDGASDLAVGASGDDDGGAGRGAVWILFLNDNGTVKSHQKISDTAGGFAGPKPLGASSLASLGDLDSDGVDDLAVGAPGDDDGGTNRGAVWILFLNNDGTVKLHQKISNTEGGFTGMLDDYYGLGRSLASIDDLDGDGLDDLVLGAGDDDDGGFGRGAVWVLFLSGGCSSDLECHDDVFCNGAETCGAGSLCEPATNPCTDPSFPLCNELTDTCDPIPDTGFRSPASTAPRLTAWISPTNAFTSDDANAVSGNDAGVQQDWTDFGFLLPPDSTIRGVEIEIEHHHASDTDTGIYTCRLIDGTGLVGTPKDGPDHGHLAEAIELLPASGGVTDTWGAALTQAVVESAEFGITCHYVQTAGGGGNKLLVDHWQMKAYFTICGNGNLDPGEECDDGNTDQGDCCSSTCLFEANGSTCGDEDPCSEDDACDGSGKCVPGEPLICDDGLFCNGVETCDTLLGCQAGTPVNCNDGVGCTVDSCNESTDTCDNIPDDASCEDELFCNGVETCDALLGCQVGTAVDCDDGVGCTVDSCIETADSCDNVSDDASCDDGLVCNGAETCDTMLGCQAGTPIPGCCKSDLDCDNGLFCDGEETCDPMLLCQAGTPIACPSDGVACTDEFCNEAIDSCDNFADDASCDDGLFCTGIETCDVLLDCQAGTPEACNDGVDCTTDFCNAATDSCDSVPDDDACDNDLFCDGEETCDATLGCQAGTPVDCPSDGVSCTEDICNETTDSCDNVPDDAACDNGLFCDGEETCDPMLGCQAGIPVNCPSDGVDCTEDVCNEATDSCYVPDDVPCDDGVFCNGQETCDLTLGCQAGSPVNCPFDGVSCTEDVCNEATDACHIPNDLLCDDGLFCTGIETCDPLLGGCQAGSDPCPGEFCDEVGQQCEPAPTYSLELVEVNGSDVGPAPSGDATVPPNALLTIEVFVRDWSPVGQELSGYQFTIDSAGYTGGSSGNIYPQDWSATTDINGCSGGGPAGDPNDDNAFIDIDSCFADETLPPGEPDPVGSDLGPWGISDPCTFLEDCLTGAMCELPSIDWVHGGISLTNINPFALSDDCEYLFANSLSGGAAGRVSEQDGSKFYVGTVVLRVSNDADGDFTLCLDSTDLLEPFGDPENSFLRDHDDEPVVPVQFECLSLTIGEAPLCATNLDCEDGDPCTTDLCNVGACEFPPSLYGDVDGSGETDLDDLMCMMEGLSGVLDCAGMVPDDLDVHPCDTGDGELDLYDLLAMLDALGGSPPCPDGCP